MPRHAARFIASSLITALALCLSSRAALAADAGPTVFQRAIGSWMGVVALVADEGEGDRNEGSDEPRDRNPRAGRTERGGREWRGPREWSRPGERPQWSGSGRPIGPRPGMPERSPGMRAMSGMRAEAGAKLDEIVERLSRIERKLDASPRMGNPWSPRPESRSPRGFSGPDGRSHGAMAAPPELQERVRSMMEQGRKRMAEAQEKMEQARHRFHEMEERIKKLEAEVERLKASK